jgi:uncharacterized protein with NRDE domain
MCLILVAYRIHPEFPMIVVANRDEFYERPTANASIWPEPSGILAGRDLQAQGTWLGVTASGRFAAVTNYRGDDSVVSTNTSRGSLVAEFLRSGQESATYLPKLITCSDNYQGYNLLVFDGENLAYASNRGSDRLQLLQAGIYGLSNQHLNTSWPKVNKGRAALQSLIGEGEVSADNLMELVSDSTPAPDSELPDTGVPLDWERMLSAAFVSSETYGTRSTTVVKISHSGQIEFVERTFGAGDEESITQRFKFNVGGEITP